MPFEEHHKYQAEVGRFMLQKFLKYSLPLEETKVQAECIS
jgi:hypothetical protein